MTSPGNGRTLMPDWLERYLITGMLGVIMVLADRRIMAVETQIADQEKERQAFALQYVEDRASLLEGQRQALHDLRILCGNKNLNMPCPVEAQ